MSLWVCRKLMHVRWLFGRKWTINSMVVKLSQELQASQAMESTLRRWTGRKMQKCGNPNLRWHAISHNLWMSVDVFLFMNLEMVFQSGNDIYIYIHTYIHIYIYNPWVVLYYNTSLYIYIHVYYVHLNASLKEPSRGRIHPAFNGGWTPKLGGHGAENDPPWN